MTVKMKLMTVQSVDHEGLRLLFDRVDGSDNLNVVLTKEQSRPFVCGRTYPITIGDAIE
jgi:hypothetical protein